MHRTWLIGAALLWTTSVARAEEPAAPAAPEAAGRIAGRIIGEDDLLGAVVVVCDAATGIPLHPADWRPFTQGVRVRQGNDELAIVHTRTKDDGTFAFNHVPAGTYRLVAQSWTDEFHGLLKPNGEVIQLHGVAPRVVVPSPEAEQVSIEPLGNGSLEIDQESPNNDSLLIVSSEPPLGDPILGFVGLGERFATHMIGANVMPYGRTTIRGLPPGRVHVGIFVNDNSPGFGSGSFDLPQAAAVSVPIVAGWSNAHHAPPDHLLPVMAALRAAAGGDNVSHDYLYEFLGIDPEELQRIREEHADAPPTERAAAELRLLGSLERQVQLTGVGEVRVIDLMAALGYIQLDAYLGARRSR